MPKAYIIAHIDIENVESFRTYVGLSLPLVTAHGGQYLARGGASEQREGTLRGRHVVIEFPDIEHAQGFYDSVDYADAKALRQRSASADLVIVEGLGD